MARQSGHFHFLTRPSTMQQRTQFPITPSVREHERHALKLCVAPPAQSVLPPYHGHSPKEEGHHAPVALAPCGVMLMHYPTKHGAKRSTGAGRDNDHKSRPDAEERQSAN